jgi:WD40 repeat protein
MSWEFGRWSHGTTPWSAVGVIEMSGFGTWLPGMQSPGPDEIQTNVHRTNIHTLRGHTSTVRCLKMSNARTAISGSRDTTLRIWDLQSGVCTRVLTGHQASVRCLEIHGDLIVSGSYDTTAKIWSISSGQCLRTLQGHFSQIYAVAFDGHRIATGSLDTSVRIWNPHDGYEVSHFTLTPSSCASPFMSKHVTHL